MARKEIGTSWDRNNRIAMNDNFKELYKAPDVASEAKTIANQADTKSTEAIQTATQTMEEMTAIIREQTQNGDLAPEITQARQGEPTLGDNLNSIKSQLAQKVSYDEILNSVRAANATSPLAIPTYAAEAGYPAQAVHPRAIYDANAKYGYRWIMAFTPYPSSNDTFENPSIVVSTDGKNWTVPTGLINPLAEPDVPGNDHLSDVDIFDNGSELELWYRQTDKVNSLSRLWRRTSTDAVNWSAPQVVFDYGTGGNGYVSPNVVIRNGYNLYYKKNTSLAEHGYVLRTSADGATWGAEQTVNLDLGDMWKDYTLWHAETNYINGMYYCLVYAITSANQIGGKLFVLESTDGINFSNSQLVMAPSDNGFDSGHLYKASMVLWGNQYWIHYSAFDKQGNNFIGLSIGRNDPYTLEGYKPELEGKYNIERIFNSVGRNVYVEPPFEFIKRLKLTKSGIGSTFLGTTTPRFIKSYRYADENLETSGGFEGFGFKFNQEIGGGATIPNDTLTFDEAKKRIKIRRDNVDAHIPNFINLSVAANGGAGVLTVYDGGEFVESLNSNATGFYLTLKNIPNGITPAVNIILSSGTPPVNSAGEYAKDWYIRGRTNTTVNIGLKSDITSAIPMSLSELNAGQYDITILF